MYNKNATFCEPPAPSKRSSIKYTNIVNIALMSKINLKRAKVQPMLNLHHSLNFCHLIGKQLLVAAKCIKGGKLWRKLKNGTFTFAQKKCFFSWIDATLFTPPFGSPTLVNSLNKQSSVYLWIMRLCCEPIYPGYKLHQTNYPITGSTAHLTHFNF